MKECSEVVMKFSTGSASFQPEFEDASDADKSHAMTDEVARILREIACKVERRGLSGDGEIVLRDLNGNKIGFFTATHE